MVVALEYDSEVGDFGFEPRRCHLTEHMSGPFINPLTAGGMRHF